MRAFQRTGTIIKTVRPTEDIVARIAYLIAQNRARHGSSGGPQAVLDALNAQRATGLLDDAVAFLGLRGPDLVAATVCYEHGDRLYARYFGYDYTSTAPTNEYFLLTYHAPLDYAAEGGFRRYRTAISAWDVKVRRGARLTPSPPWCCRCAAPSALPPVSASTTSPRPGGGGSWPGPTPWPWGRSGTAGTPRCRDPRTETREP